MQESAPSFWHHGKHGDIIYSLVACKMFGSFHYRFPEWLSGLVPILEAQPYVLSASCGDPLPADRNLSLPGDQIGLYRNHLAQIHWYNLGGIVPLDLSQPWLLIPPVPKAEIVVTQTPRYTDGSWDWSALRRYADRAVYVGLKCEWLESGLAIPYHPVSSLFEFAQIVSGSKLYVANQTFGFSLAEAMKVNRVLCPSKLYDNCRPQSPNGHTDLTDEIIERYLD